MSNLLAIVSIVMFAMLFYRFALIRFFAPIWVILFVLQSGYAATAIGLVAIIAFAVALLFFVLDEITAAKKKAAKAAKTAKGENAEEDDSLFDEDEVSDLPRMSAFSDDEQSKGTVSRPKKSKLTILTGTLCAHGFAPYEDKPGNDRSYFVDCDGHKVWGIGLKDAIEKAGAKTGDVIRFWKGGEVRTTTARVFDKDGNVTGTRELDEVKRRGVWVVEVV